MFSVHFCVYILSLGIFQCAASTNVGSCVCPGIYVSVCVCVRDVSHPDRLFPDGAVLYDMPRLLLGQPCW